MSDNDKMREAFEKWYMTNTFAHVDHLSVFYNDLNCYPTPIANHCWKAWQAAQSERVPEGWQLVPTVLTQGMAEAYWLAYDECSEGSHLGICYAAMLAAAPQPNKEGE